MSEMNLESGIVLIDKPAGMTSFSVVARIRRILNVKKVGHAGTLDPFATGLLTVAVGRATRVLRYMENHDKTYLATMVLGKKTSTGDVEGEVIGGKMPSAEEVSSLMANDGAEIRKAVSSMIGEITQVPSVYSAIKINGRPAYDYARKGEQVEMKSRTVTIHSIEVQRIFEEQGVIRVNMTVSCSKGTYIRSLCEDIGEKLGYGAFCEELRRLSSGQYKLSEACTLEKIEEMVQAGEYGFFLSEDTVFTSFPKVEVSRKEAKALGNGKKLDFSLFRDRMEKVKDVTSGARVLACCEGRSIAVIYVSDEAGQLMIREERVLEDVR